MEYGEASAEKEKPMHNTDFQLRQTFGRNLDRIRRAKGKTQLDVAREAGISQPAINNYINVVREPKLSAAVRIAEALDVKLEELLK